jgi:hypothetical protein
MGVSCANSARIVEGAAVTVFGPTEFENEFVYQQIAARASPLIPAVVGLAESISIIYIGLSKSVV